MVHDGIRQVGAELQNRALVLTVLTTRGRFSVWRDPKKRQVITEQLVG